MDQVIVGFKEEEETIFDRLTRGSTQVLDVVSIVGMPGLGKTTLAKKIYNNPSIRLHFNRCAWCTISQSYQGKNLLLDILSAVSGVGKEDIAKMADEDLAQRLYESLKGQRYLVVLDDIWDIGAWDVLKQAFPDDKNGSRILFTSRIQSVALQALSNSYLLPLRTLTDEESWELMVKKLFHKDACPKIFSEIGKDIARNCKGLPLSIVLTSGLLAQRVEDLEWWKQIARSSVSLWSAEGYMDIIELSYKHLPDYLKPCFLYFAAFPEDKAIRAKKLINLWIAEGFVQRHEVKRAEDVAKEYLMDLVARSLIIVRSEGTNGGIKECSIHDLLREFCLAKGREKGFLLVLPGNDATHFSKGAEYKHERLCIHSLVSYFLQSNAFGSRVHSLLFPTNADIERNILSSLANFINLQVLDLENIGILSYYRLELLMSLILLRYLAVVLTFPNCLFVPPSISNLVNLETLILKHNINYSKQLICRDTIWTMKKLRHVEVGKFEYFLDDDGLDQVAYQLESMHKFSTPIISCPERAERLFRRIPNVRKLSFQFDPLRSIKLMQFPRLDILIQLESLHVYYLHHSYPLDLYFPPALKKLTLEGRFRKPWSAMSVIGKLPNLEVLKLRNEPFHGTSWAVEEDEFLKLKFLKLSSVFVEEWNASDDSFPCLERLVVQGCESLSEIPESFGYIPTLKSITVFGCKSELERSAREIEKQQHELSNEDFIVNYDAFGACVIA